MIPFTITDKDMRRAELHLITRLGVVHPEQTDFMQDNIIGALGEIAVYNWINQWSPCYFSDSHSKYDLLLGDARTVEVKTLRTSSIPQPHYQCSVFMKQWEHKQDSSIWVFVRIDKSLTYGWIVATCDSSKRDRFTFHAQGDPMPSGKPYRLDTMSCLISELDDPARMVIHA
jgi:hypothetical protein